MALETAAAVIGILAAAGKVAELLGPVVSAFQDATKHTAAVLSEVNNSRIILAALQRYLYDLGTSPRTRKELIQVDQLVAALMDGVLLFSELEELVLRFTSSGATMNRLRWALNDEKFGSLVSRVQCFKGSITVMLNILQCESDMEAHQSRQELLTLTTSLLANNVELAKRIAHLEDCFDNSRSTSVSRPASLATSRRPAQHNSGSKLQETNDSLSVMLYGTSTDLPFEKILFSSRVYHKARNHTSDVSFRSSIAPSHAWTALSDLSLSDISNLSVVALPIQSNDLTNPQHYTFRRAEAGPDNQSSLLKLPGPLRSTTLADDTTLGDLADLSQSFFGTSIIVKGSSAANPHDFVKQFATLAGPRKIGVPGELVTSYHIGDEFSDISQDLSIHVIDDGPLVQGICRASMDRQMSTGGSIFLLLYSVTSRISFDRIVNYNNEVIDVNKRKGARAVCILVVGVHNGKIRGRTLIEEGAQFALGVGGEFAELDINDHRAIHMAVKERLMKFRLTLDEEQMSETQDDGRNDDEEGASETRSNIRTTLKLAEALDGTPTSATKNIRSSIPFFGRLRARSKLSFQRFAAATSKIPFLSNAEPNTAVSPSESVDSLLTYSSSLSRRADCSASVADLESSFEQEDERSLGSSFEGEDERSIGSSLYGDTTSIWSSQASTIYTENWNDFWVTSSTKTEVPEVLDEMHNGHRHPTRLTDILESESC